IDKKKDEFEKLRSAFDKQQGSLNEDALVQKQEELLQKERDIKRSFKDSQDALRRKNALMVQDLLKEMRRAVAAIGKEEGFTVILEKGSQAVLYADNSIDITDEVVKRFDNQTK
ncbi:MAG: OmpH family outer membrane protein, partial [Bdellovibrionales bacterium]|nr:OmpH family outer membrane protein [Bdellovibrionales bacterium]